MGSPNLSHVSTVSDEELRESVKQFMTQWDDKDELLLFCYGSLLWKLEPFMRYIGRADLEGMHRDFCVWSVSHRGTFEKPGLVLGLIPGGFCQGAVVKIDDNDREENLFVLWKREMITKIYVPLILEVEKDGGRHKALTFIVDQNHPQFAAGLTLAEKLAVIRSAYGKSGRNLDYANNTLDHLRSLVIQDPFMEKYSEQANTK